MWRINLILNAVLITRDTLSNKEEKWKKEFN